MPDLALHELEQLDRVDPARLLAILPGITTPQALEHVGFLMEKTPYSKELAQAFLARALNVGLDTVFAQAYIDTLLPTVSPEPAKRTVAEALPDFY